MTLLQANPQTLSNYSQLPDTLKERLHLVQLETDHFWRYTDSNLCYSVKFVTDTKNSTNLSLLTPRLKEAAERSRNVMKSLDTLIRVINVEVAAVSSASQTALTLTNEICNKQKKLANVLNPFSGDQSDRCKEARNETHIMESFRGILEATAKEVSRDYVVSWTHFSQEIEALRVKVQPCMSQTCNWSTAQFLEFGDMFLRAVSRLNPSGDAAVLYRQYYNGLCVEEGDELCTLKNLVET